jgi:hypothetical protein
MRFFIKMILARRLALRILSRSRKSSDGKSGDRYNSQKYLAKTIKLCTDFGYKVAELRKINPEKYTKLDPMYFTNRRL